MLQRLFGVSLALGAAHPLDPAERERCRVEMQEAVGDCNEALRLQPDYINALDSRGFVLLRGMPVEDRLIADSATAYWGVGTYFGSARSQNAKGHLLGHVYDQGRAYGNIDVRGVGWGAYVLSRPAANQEIGAAIMRLVDMGHVRPVVGQRFALEQAAGALQVIDRREAVGKVVLDVMAT